MKMKWLEKASILLVSIALINWPLDYFFSINLVSMLSFGIKAVQATIYGIVGVLGVLTLTKLVK